MFTSSLFNEIINIMILITRKNVEECIAHYIAFEVIANIGNMYLEHIGFYPLKEAIETPLKTRHAPIPFRQRSCWNKFVRCLYRFMYSFYASVYYYFTPFIVILLPYYSAYYNIVNYSFISLHAWFGLPENFG